VKEIDAESSKKDALNLEGMDALDFAVVLNVFDVIVATLGRVSQCEAKLRFWTISDSPLLILRSPCYRYDDQPSGAVGSCLASPGAH
jgi:hypothetical protein